MATTTDETTLQKDDNEYDLLNKESAELRALIQQVRAEANLLPLFKAKRPFSAISRDEQDHQEEESPRTKQAEHTDESENNKINDRDEMMARLSSFSFLFQYIPRPVSALDCAKHGWKDTRAVTEKDENVCVLSCDTCKDNMFVIDCDYKRCDPQKANDIKSKYESGLYRCHKEDCQWRHKKCEDRVYNLPLSTISEGLERFQSEAKNLVSACQNKEQPFPKIQHPLDNQILTRMKYFAKRATNTLDKEEKSSTIEDMESAYLLSLYGWQSLDHNIPGVKCELCFSKKAFYQIKKDESFDVLEEHKSYCPWINATTADAYTPRGFSAASRNKRISGSEWMQQVTSLEYGLLVKKEDLSLSSRELADEKLYHLKQKLYNSYDLLSKWQSHLN